MSRVRLTIHGQAGIIKTSNPGGEGREPAYDCSVLHPRICADPVQHVVEDLLTRAVMYVTFRIIKKSLRILSPTSEINVCSGNHFENNICFVPTDHNTH